MPIYEYECVLCGHRIEELQSIKAMPLTDCPKCGKPGLSRLISRTSFSLKGTGWARQGYSNQEPPDSSGGDGSGGHKS
jgi:putative FmdB family regulatory protein